MKVSCGCGFEVSDGQPDQLRVVFDEHDCSCDADSWHDSIFSIPGAVTILAVGWVVVEIIKAVAR